MGLTVENILERALEEILQAGGVSRPGFDVQSGAVLTAATTMTVEGRHSNIPPDSLLEWWDSSMEIAETKSVSGTTVTFQSRGYLGTTAADHVTGTKVVVDNPYPRYVLLNGLKAVIGQLRGYGLYARGYTDSLTMSSLAPVALPTGAVGVLDVRYQVGTMWRSLLRDRDYQVLNNWTGVDTPPAIQFFSGRHGAAMKVLYKKDFTTSTFTLATDLETTVGVPSALAPHLALGLAGHILQGRDVPSLESEHIRPDPQNPQQPGTRASIGRLLWDNFIRGPVATERVKGLETNPTVMSHERSY